MDEYPRYGIVEPEGIYIMSGDPGADSSPRRNTAVIAVMDTNGKRQTYSLV